MAQQPPRKEFDVLKQLQRMFVCIAIASGLMWVWQGQATTPSQWHIRLAITGGAFIGACVTTFLITRKR